MGDRKIKSSFNSLVVGNLLKRFVAVRRQTNRLSGANYMQITTARSSLDLSPLLAAQVNNDTLLGSCHPTFLLFICKICLAKTVILTIQ